MLAVTRRAANQWRRFFIPKSKLQNSSLCLHYVGKTNPSITTINLSYGTYYGMSKSFSPRFISASSINDEKSGENLEKNDGKHEKIDDQDGEEEDLFAELDFDTNHDNQNNNHDKEENEEDDDDDDNDEEDRGKETLKGSKLALLEIPLNSKFEKIVSSLDEWLEQGNVVTKSEAMEALKGLRSRRMYPRALTVSSWLWTKRLIDFDPNYYAAHLDCVFNAHGADQAESFLQSLPSHMKGIIVYRTLLKNYANRRNIPRAEELFRTMNAMWPKLDTADYNLMLLLYSLAKRQKIMMFLKEMESACIKPDIYTYRILIYTKGTLGDIAGMIELMENMKEEGFEPNSEILAIIAKQCVKSAMTEKAGELLSELERLCDLEKDFLSQRSIVRNLLWFYALLNRETDVERHWKKIENDDDIPLLDYAVGIRIWGQLGKIDKAEQIFQNMLERQHILSAKHYKALLDVYVNHKLLSKAKDLVEKMSKSGIRLQRPIRTSLIKLYVGLGDMEKAESMLSDDYGHMTVKPCYLSIVSVLKKYAETGDVSSAERIFDKMREMGYKRKFKMYSSLLHAYVIAKVPAHKLKHAMREDRFIPSKAMVQLIEQLDLPRTLDLPRKLGLPRKLDLPSGSLRRL